MKITTVYDLEMAKFIHVKLLGADQAAGVRADKAEEDTNSGKLVLKLGNEKVGDFSLSQVAGWWISDSTRKE